MTRNMFNNVLTLPIVLVCPLFTRMYLVCFDTASITISIFGQLFRRKHKKSHLLKLQF
ncbi:hypothetical protein Hanom_Chr04g00352271 [Helianthus anomalus]